MRTHICKPTGEPVIRLGMLLLLMSLSAPLAAWAADSSYVNYGSVVGQPPQVDATNFVNYGTFDLTTDLPFSPSDTLNYSNLVSYPGSGVMIGSPGWKFDREPSDIGVPGWSSIFFNDNLGLIQAVDPYITLYAPAGGVVVVNPAVVSVSKLLVSATNIVNHGTMVVGANGLLRLSGDHIDLSRGTLQVTSTSSSAEAQGSYNNQPVVGYFLPDVGMADYWWGVTNINFESASLWNGTVASTPVHTAVGPTVGTTWRIQYSFVPQIVDWYTNSQFTVIQTTNQDGSPGFVNLISNVVKQAVFVATPPNLNFSAQTGFFPSSNISNLLQTVTLLMTLPLTNRFDGSLQTASIYLKDDLGSEEGHSLLTDFITGQSFRPTNYLVSRVNQGLGSPGYEATYGLPEPNFFIDSGALVLDPVDFSVDIDTNTYIRGAPDSAYNTYVDRNVSQLPNVASGTVTNLPGRVEIYGKSVDLDRARIRGEGEVIVKTPNLLSTSNLVIDCENLSFNVDKPDGNLRVKNLAGGAVSRLGGDVWAWSAAWSNTATVVIQNNYTISNSVSTNGVTNTVAIQTPLTNNVAVRYHVLMLWMREMSNSFPVMVYDFVTHTTNVVIDDNMTVVESFLIDGKSLVLNGNLTLTGTSYLNMFGPGGTVQIPNWIYTNAPNLLYFTNNGTLSVSNELHLGDDRSTPYSDIVNNGTIVGASIGLSSDYFINTGDLAAQGPILIRGGAGSFQSGSATAGGVVQYSFNTLKFNNFKLTANGQCYFNVTNALFDSGPGAGNIFSFDDGFNMFNYPASSSRGDLLGTTFNSTAPGLLNSTSIKVDHYWAAADFGPSAAGYSDNEAIGRLALSSQVSQPTFYFSGTSASGTNGLYVDLLDLTALGTNYANDIEINPNLVIYYAAAKLGFTPPPDANNVAQEPEEYLDGRFGGHLRWVSSFAGPNSYVDAVIVNCNGQQQSIRVNAALRNSMRIDSDGDGLVNGLDPFPFNTNPNGDPFAAPLPCPIGLDASLQAMAPHAFVTITAPTSGQSILTPSALLQGTAGGQSGRATVYYQVNGGGWTPAASPNGGANWSGSVNLGDGLNVVQAYAIDSSGQLSPTQSVDVTHVPSAPLALAINGVGTVGPYTNGQWLPLNNMYTVLAYPGPGYTFSNWTGDYFSTSPTLKVWMNASKSLVANFAPPVYSAESATYSGLFYESNQDVNFGKSGGVTITTSGKGGYSAKLLLGGYRYALHGKFGASGAAGVTNYLRGGGRLIVHLQVDTTDNSRITGTVSNGAWVADLEALRSVDQFAGNYTMVVPGSGDVTDTGEPYGDGYAVVSVNRGKVKIKGALADGTRITCATTVSRDGRCPIDVTLYHGGGQILGWLTFTNQPQAGLSGWLDWHKEPAVPRTLYPDGFDLETTNVMGSAYDSSAGPVTRFNTGSVVFSGGDLPVDITNNVSIDSGNRVNDLTLTNKLKLKLKKSQGLFSGKLADPSNPKKALRFGGVILQGLNTGSGYGYFLGGEQSGRVTLGP